MNKVFSLIICTLPVLLMGQKTSTNPENSAGQVIRTIIQNTKAEEIPNTADIIKEGDPETQVTGIVTCMFASMNVLKKAVEKNCNLIVVHEPIYYNHWDDTETLQNDPVFHEKQQYIKEHKLVIWRFHDYAHSVQPDVIFSGMIRKLGWEPYRMDDKPGAFSFPEMPLTAFLANLKKTFPENTFQVVGNPAMTVKNVSFAPGAPGPNYHLPILGDSNIDVMVAGEVAEWETYEYVRDAYEQGRNKAIVFIGHINSEEGGMEYCAEWLGEFIKGIPVNFVSCGSSYWTY